MKESENIRLRALRESDNEILHKWVNDPEIVKFTYFFHPVSEMEQKEWFASLSKKQNQVIFCIEIKQGEKLIGTCGFYDINHVCRKAELVIKICDKTMRGKGYGREVLEILMDFGFSDLNLRRIWLRVLADNERAIKLYQNAGFITEGLLKEDHYIQGEYKDVIVMAFIRR
jgi:UDP-4-amino-4,6-dideoxy-N-acetyl-beta-L-altrosamine N-acetyltransferase